MFLLRGPGSLLQDAPATPPQDYQKYQPTKSEGITLQPHPALQEPGRQSEEAQSSQMHLDLRQVQVSKPKAVNVFELFLAFCNFGTRMETQEMDCAHFSKFCRDCKLIGKGLSSTDVDLLFTRVKSIGQRRIVYEEFVEALTVIAEKKNKTLKQLTTEVLAVGGPAMKATKASYTRLHDDKNTYTGVYARGGPTNVDERISLDKMVLRTDPKDFGTPRMVLSGGSSLTPRGGGSAGFTTRATSLTPRSGRIQRTPRVHASAETGDYNSKALNDSGKLERITPRGTPPLSARTNASKHSSPGSVPRLTRNPPPQGYDQQSPSARPPSAPSADYEVPWNEPDSRAELKRVYNSFAAFGHTHAKGSTPRDQAVEMENKQFVKLVRDAGLLGGSLNVTRLDIIFSKVKGKGLRKINFQGFEMALTLLSEERGYTLNQTYNAIVSTAGPQLNHVTTPEFVKYHDDKSMYTGVYSRGGPTSVDKRITLDKMVTRSDDVYHNSRTPRFVA